MATASRALAALLGAALAVLPQTAARATEGDDFVTRVHVAASYGMAAGRLAQTRGEPGMRTIGATIARQNAELEDRVRTAAAALGVELPPADPGLPARQLRSGPEWAMRLRSTDAALLQQAVTVRVSTRDPIVRDLAHHTAATMMAQLPLLEGSGLIDLAALPTPAPSAAPTPPPGAGPAADPEMLARAREGRGFLWPAGQVILIVLAVAVAGAAFTARRLIRLPAKPPRRHRTPRHRG